MRRGVAEAVWHARHRSAFGARLVEQPAMVNVLADLALESEAATATALRLARAYDEGDHALRRFATAVAKYWICKRATPHAAEALECLGGNGYVEESPLPRLLRDAPLNGIWEGSGNVIALDVLRALAREPEALPRSSPSASWPAAATRGWTPPRRAAELARPRRVVARAARRGGARARLPGVAARPPRAGRGGRRVLRGAPGRRRGARFGTLPPASTARRSSSAAPRRCNGRQQEIVRPPAGGTRLRRRRLVRRHRMRRVPPTVQARAWMRPDQLVELAGAVRDRPRR